jgi:hypothetical protein
MATHIRKTIAEAQARLDEQEEAVRQTKRLINQLCEFAGDPPMYPDVDEHGQNLRVANLQGDEYYGQKQSTACRLILERRKALNLGPATLNELHEELLAGGYRFSAKDADTAKRSLYMMLTKNTVTFHRLPNGKFGLAAWYPNSKKQRRRPKGGESDDGAEIPDDEGNGREPVEELQDEQANNTPT